MIAWSIESDLENAVAFMRPQIKGINTSDLLAQIFLTQSNRVLELHRVHSKINYRILLQQDFGLKKFWLENKQK